MKLSDLLFETKEILSKENIHEPLRESKLLICHVLFSSLEIFLLELEKKISPLEEKKIFELVYRRAKGEPFAYLTNSVSFYKNIFYVNSNVLIPRPETEELIETVLKNISNKNLVLNILDIGTGSGIILASLLKQLPNSYGIATDISIDALKVAKKNLTELNIIHRSKLINSNWSEGIKNSIFDIITCNPPYIADRYIKNLQKDIKKYEPLIALKGGINGLESFKSLLPLARQAIKCNGLLALEIGFDQSEQLSNILYKNKFLLKEIIKDLSGSKRVLIAEPF
jgi:release factor glutamine methyltransferase